MLKDRHRYFRVYHVQKINDWEEVSEDAGRSAVKNLSQAKYIAQSATIKDKLLNIHCPEMGALAISRAVTDSQLSEEYLAAGRRIGESQD